MSTERSKSGIPVLRHDAPAETEWIPRDPALVAAVRDHVERCFGPIGHVVQEVAPVHACIDLLLVMPSSERPAITLVTAGMSARPMANGEYAELMLILPPTWPTDGDPALSTAAGYWPYTLLKQLARLPHEFQTALHVGDTVPNGDPPTRYSGNTKLCGAMIAPMVMPNIEGAEVFTHDGREIELLSVWPLHADEMQVKLDEGTDRLWDLLDEAKIMEILHEDRPSVVPKRRSRFFRR